MIGGWIGDDTGIPEFCNAVADVVERLLADLLFLAELANCCVGSEGIEFGDASAHRIGKSHSSNNEPSLSTTP